MVSFFQMECGNKGCMTLSSETVLRAVYVWNTMVMFVKHVVLISQTISVLILQESLMCIT